MLIEAAKPLNYGRRLYRIGDQFEATKQHAWLLVAVGKCNYVVSALAEQISAGKSAPNEMRSIIGLEAIEGGNSIYQPIAEQPKRKRGRPRKIKEAID